MIKKSLEYTPIDDWKAKAQGGEPDSEAMLYKHFVDTKIKAEGDEGSRRIRMVISTKAIDRDNDTIDPSGWKVANYLKNPVVLWAHNSSMPPIGRAVDIIQNDERLVAIDEFVERDVLPLADTVFRMLKSGFLRASSVGFRPRKSAFNEDRRGFDFLEQELLEHSIVPVPSNPEALIEARSALGKDIMRPLIDWCEEALDTWNDEKGLWLPKEKIERALQAVEAKSFVTVEALSEKLDATLASVECKIEELTRDFSEAIKLIKSGKHEEVDEQDDGSDEDLLASWLNGVEKSEREDTTNISLLDGIDGAQIRGIVQRALDESVSEAIKREYTSLTGRLID